MLYVSVDAHKWTSHITVMHWRRFCHIPLDDAVPHPTTLSTLTRKYGPEVLQDLNQLLVRQAGEHKVLRGRKLRVDTKVIQAPIEHPTDSGLVADAVRVVTRTVKHMQAAGAAVRTVFRNPLRTVKGALRAVDRALRTRTGEAKAAVDQQTARVLRITRQVARRARRVLANSRRVVQDLPGRATAVVQRKRAQLRQTLELCGATDGADETAPARHHLDSRSPGQSVRPRGATDLRREAQRQN